MNMGKQWRKGALKEGATMKNSRLSAKTKLKKRLHSVKTMRGSPFTPALTRVMQRNLSTLITGSDTSVQRCVALDCEMVGTGLSGSVSMLGRCSIVNHHGNVIYDTYVAPLAPVTDYRTRWSGISPHHLRGAPNFETVQSRVKEILGRKILIGHGLKNDLEVLDITHPLKDIRDTCLYTFDPFQKNKKGEWSKLKTQLKRVMGIEIQNGGHNSVVDAQAAMVLYQRSKEIWEASLLQKQQ